MNHISKLVGQELTQVLTGKQLGMVMDAVNRAYQEGKSSNGDVAMVDTNAVWIGKLGKIYEIEDIGRISKRQVITRLENIPLNSSDCWSGAHGKWIDGKYYQLFNARNSDGTKLGYSLPHSCKNGEYIADGVCTEEVTEFS